MRIIARNVTSKASRGFAASCCAAALMLVAAAGVGLAKPKGGGGPPGGGGHPAGGVHFNAAHISAPHFHAAPHFAARPHFTPHFAPHSHFAAHPHFAPHISTSHEHHFATPLGHPNGHASRFAHDLNRHGNHATTLAHPLTSTVHPVANNEHFNRLAHASDPKYFADRRRLASNAAFRPFWHHDWWRHGWHPYYHLGWIGPLFWPYAYGDFFYYALWPYDYEYADPFWVYGYGDIYESIFTPYDYEEYVQGPGAPARMATLTESMAQSCNDEAAEVTGWPIDQIQSAVQPNPQQTALLDALGNAIVEASHQIKIHCPTSVAFTPTDRLDQMHQRLQTLIDALNIVSPPLTKFYDSLSDEQKARFNDIAPPAPPPQQNAQNAQNAQGPQGQSEPQQGQPSVQAQCNASVMAWPTDRIENAIHPNDAQRAKLDALQSALSQAADTIKAACPTEAPATPPDRLAAVGKHLQAMLQGVETVQPALADFYNSLSDDQKARFNTMGKQLFAQNQE